jgi:hypothetical protein
MVKRRVSRDTAKLFQFDSFFSKYFGDKRSYRPMHRLRTTSRNGRLHSPHGSSAQTTQNCVGTPPEHRALGERGGQAQSGIGGQ